MDNNSYPVPLQTYEDLLFLSGMTREKAKATAREHFKAQHGEYPEDYKPKDSDSCFFGISSQSTIFRSTPSSMDDQEKGK